MVDQLRRQPITGLGVMCRSCCSAGLHSGAVLASAIVILGGVGESHGTPNKLRRSLLWDANCLWRACTGCIYSLP